MNKLSSINSLYTSVNIDKTLVTPVTPSNNLRCDSNNSNKLKPNQRVNDVVTPVTHVTPEKALNKNISASQSGGLEDILRAAEKDLPAQIHGIAINDLKMLACDDWSECIEDKQLLDAFARAVSCRLQREQGIVPKEWTTVVHCKGCGPVYLWPGLTDVIACPWCINRGLGLPIPCPKTENTY